MKTSRIKSLSPRVDMVGDGVGAEDMGGEWVELRRGIAEKEGEGNGGERVRIGMSGRVCENHDEWLQVASG